MIPSVLATAAEGLPLEHVATAAGAAQYAWLIPVVPAVSALLLLLFGRRLGRVSALIAIAAMAVSAVLATLVFTYLQSQPEESRTIVSTIAPWITAGPLQVNWEVLVDPLSSVMLLLVTWVGLLIHIYSVGYMHGDERYSRFFAYLNLFAASMLVLVLEIGRAHV